jgi:large subunit ribosomal protein L25
MPDVALAATLRDDSGARPSRRLRTEGRIPAVLYGHGGEPVAISVDARELRNALQSQTGGAVIVGLHIGSEEHLAMAREIQRHPVRRVVTHIDFQIVSRDEVVPADVPILLVGEALAVSRAGGNLEHALLSLHVRARADQIPPSIEVDVTDLEIGDSIRVGDLNLPPGLAIDLEPETPVVLAQAPHAAVVEEVEPTEGAAAEAESEEEH